MAEPMIAPMPPVDDDELLENYRGVTITQGFMDGSFTTRSWYIETAQAERVASMLGAPQEVMFVPTSDAERIAEVADNCPTIGGDFFA